MARFPMSEASRERLRKYYEAQLRLLDAPERKQQPKATVEARKRVWRHNSFLGFCALARTNMQTIADSDTATPLAIAKAYAIQEELAILQQLLKERID